MPTFATARFGQYEVDVRSGELRRNGTRVRLQEQPFQVLAALLERAGDVVTREELRQRLWPADTFVDFDHGLNTAVKKLREALSDSATNPRFLETLPKRGYRFIAPVQLGDHATPQAAAPASASPQLGAPEPVDELPRPHRGLVRGLFIAAQVMYLAFYVAALFRLEAVHARLEPLTASPAILAIIVITAAAAIPVRFYLLNAVAFDYPHFGFKFARLFPILLALDGLWSLAPFLLAHTIGMGSAIAACAALVYLPFGQRTLVRMAYRD